MPRVTVVIPALNEAEGIATTVSAVFAAFVGLEAIHPQLLVVDDGSTDATGKVVSQLMAADSRVGLLSLSRHFGKEGAIHAGLAHATGDAVIVIDGDLQHPPELIPEMVRLWQQGLPIVEAVKRRRRDESWWSRAFYAVFVRLTGLDIRNHTDFKLLDREVVEAWLALPERTRFFRGLVAWLGYPAAQVYFDVPKRSQGVSAFSQIRLWRLSLNAIAAFSSLPLQIVSWIGALYALLALVIGSLTTYQWATGQSVSGFTTVNLLILITGGALLVGLGIIGMYVALIYGEVKRRPAYRVDGSRSRLPGEDKPDSASQTTGLVDETRLSR
jgi:polyisoprenyl-phosphate glycosyltransferase